MRELWKSFSVPIAVSGLGLLLVVVLAFAPLVGRTSVETAVAVPSPEASPVMTSQADPSALDDVQVAIAAQGQSLDSLSNRLRTLEKGITRLNMRLSKQERASEGLPDLGSDLATSRAQVAILNKAVPRMNGRLRDLTGRVDAFASLPADFARAEGQIAILNKAVPRINARLSNQRPVVEALPEIQRQVTMLEGQMRILNTAVPRLQARIRALRSEISP